MYQKEDGTLLKTKIIATVGSPRKGIFDSEKKPLDGEVGTSRILDLLRQEDTPYYMVDIIRINMSFHEKDGKLEDEVFEWIQKNKDSCAKNVALLADLPGPKIRLDPRRYTGVELKKGKKIDIYFGESPKGSTDPCVLVLDVPFTKMVKKIGEPDNPKIGVFDKLGNYIRKKRSNGEEVTLIIGDGIVVFNAIAERKGVVTCSVEKGGKISKMKGLTIKKASLEVPRFFERQKDKEAWDFLLEHGKDLITHIGVSFVNDENDVLQVKYYIENQIFERLKKEYPDVSTELKKELISIQNCTDENGGNPLDESRRLAILREEARLRSPLVIAKIETQKAVKNIESIMDVADGIMIARGDLALQLDPQDVPPIQKRIIRLCNYRGKPVITATEMLNSMKDNPYPTRAEATDVFNAILDGSTAVMLSNETSEGIYPFQAVHMMAQIAEKAEKHLEKTHLTNNLRKKLNRQRYQEIASGSASLLKSHEERLKEKTYKYSRMVEDFKKKRKSERSEKEKRIEFYSWIRDYYSQKGAKTSKQITTDSISESACIMAEEKKYEAIIVSTITGRTAHMIARFRPNAKIIPAVHDEFNTRKMILSYGSYPINIELINKKTGQTYLNTDEIYDQSICLAEDKKLVRCGDMVIFVAGTPLWVLGEANLIQVKTVEDYLFTTQV